MTLRDLFQRGLLKILSELGGKDSYYNCYIWPKRIRKSISDSCNANSEEIAKRFKDMFCILTQGNSGQTVESLKSAQAIMDNDPLINAEVREDGLSMLLEEWNKLTLPRPRGIHLNSRNRNPGFADNDESPSTAQACSARNNSNNLI